MSKTATELKEKGNQAFAAKDYEEAIAQYTEAIKLDPSNHVFFSNRSASYGGKKEWSKAAEDAKQCIQLEPTFVKGYYRLATAQIELQDWDGANSTIRQGLRVDSDNSQLMKLLRTVQTKKREQAKKGQKAVSMATPGALNANMDPAVSKEVMDLQQAYVSTSREYNTVKAGISAAQREQKLNELTKDELEQIPDSKTYRAVGKMFLLSPRPEVLDYLSESIGTQKKKETELAQKLEYLERRMKSQQQNIQELTKTPSSE